ncbi:hypothetical protein D7030_11105 [Flavobacteriaceae bacterium AU392]|nr:hypothetical protein D1817_13565 [Flavobacteriaceae bacterium]RKM82708.1 hypothetical protein D7030_11105 [Flavobacteriaceae bacterium AU392]
MNAYYFDIEKIAKYLSNIQKHIASVYKWSVNLDGLLRLDVISIEEVYELNQYTLYEKEIALKFILEKKLQEYYNTNPKQFEALCMWIIQEWGGIKGAKSHITMPRVYEFIKAEKPKYEALPSVSKVGMFMYLNKNIIYDTRVIYALNWIILSQNAGTHFFPIPGGRNSKMNAFNMEVLIRLSKAKNYKPQKRSNLNKRNYIEIIDEALFIKESEAYYEAIKLIAAINKILWKDEKAQYPFYTEMLLFSSADIEIFHDITNTVILNFE